MMAHKQITTNVIAPRPQITQMMKSIVSFIARKQSEFSINVMELKMKHTRCIK